MNKDIKISVFKSLEKSSKPSDFKSFDDILNIIKDHPQKDLILKAKSPEGEGGKSGEEFMKYKGYSKERGEYPRNLYNYVKSAKIPMVTWNCVVEKQRLIANVTVPTGYIYCDIDDYEGLIDNDKFSPTNEEEAKIYTWELLTGGMFPFIKAVWKSFGGSGFGFLIAVEGLEFNQSKNINNFTSTWKSLETILAKHGVMLDPATKDITRPNVLSYDPDIFITEDDEVEAFVAVEPKQKIASEIHVVEMPKGLVADTLEHKFWFMYEFHKYSKKLEGTRHKDGVLRVTHDFYFDFFLFAINKAIRSDEAMEFLKSKAATCKKLFLGRYNEDGVEQIRNKTERYYGKKGQTSKWGIYTFKINNNAPETEDYKVESLHKEYDGDAYLKLRYVWNILKKKTYHESDIIEDRLKRLRSFSSIAKRSGIPKETLIDYLFEFGMQPEAEELKLISKVYGNSKINYGIKKVPTAGAIYANQLKFEIYAKTNNLEVIKHTRYEGCSTRKMTDIIKGARTWYKKITSENIFDFLRVVFKESKKFAITKGDAVTFVKSEFSLTEEEIEVKKHNEYRSEVLAELKINEEVVYCASFVAQEIYSYEEWKFGWQTRKTLTLEQVKSNYNIVDEIIISQGTYISDLNLTDINDKIIWGNTSMGKTTWICEHRKGKRLILVPIIPLLEQIQTSHNASVFYNQTKDVKEGDDLIVCTYSSFPTLLKIMEDWEDTLISEYELFFDEYHNFAVASNKSFRGYELNIIADNMHVFKSRTMLTGTMFPIHHPIFKKFGIIRVNWDFIPPKRFMRTRYMDKMTAIEKQLSRKGKNIIYLQNKKEEGEMGKLINYLGHKGWTKIWKINADEKNSDNFMKLKKNQRIDDDVEVLICTSVIVEGVNITNPDIATIHFMSHEGLVNSEQMVNRFRKVYNREDHECMIYTYKKIDNSYQDKTDHIDVNDIQVTLGGMAQSHLEFFNKAYVKTDSLPYKICHKIFMQSLFKNCGLYRNKEGVFEVDHFSIANMAYVEEKNYSAKDLEFTKMMLSEYNWQFVGENIIGEEMEQGLKEKLNADKEATKEDIRLNLMTILNEIRLEGEEECKSKISTANRSQLEVLIDGNMQIDLRSKVKWACYNMIFRHACNLVEEWIMEHNFSTAKWSKIIRQIAVKVGLELADQQISGMTDRVDVTTDFAKMIMKKYKTKIKKARKSGKSQLLTSNLLIKWVNEYIHLCPALDGVKITEDSALEILSKFFTVNPRVIADKVHYSISGIDIRNDVASFLPKMMEWGNKCLKTEVMMSTQEMANKLNLIRGNMPLYGMFKLNSADAMKLMRDFFTITRASTRRKNGVTTNVYKVTSLFPQEIANVLIKPLHKEKGVDKHPEEMTYDEKKLYNHQTKLNSLAYFITMENKEHVVPF